MYHGLHLDNKKDEDSNTQPFWYEKQEGAMKIQTGTRVWRGGANGEPDQYLDIEGFEYTLKDW